MKKAISVMLCVLFVFLLAFPAFCETGEAEFEEIRTTKQKIEKPAKVENFEAYKTTKSSITMHWKKVTDADAYAVYMFDKKEDDYKLVYMDQETKYTATSLKAGSTYKFIVKAVKITDEEISYSPGSEVLEAVTSPNKVKGIYTADIEKDSITLSWPAVSGATSYEAWVYNKGQGRFTLFGITDKPKVIVTGLSENTLFSFKIRAIRSIEGAVAYGEFSEVFSEFTNTSSLPRTKAQAAKLYNTKLGNLKEQEEMTVSYKKTISTETVSCSKYSLTRTVKNMMNLFAGQLEKNYKFKDGKCEDTTVQSLIEPAGKNSTLRAADIYDFSVKNEKDSLTLKLVLKPDETSFKMKNGNEKQPSHNSRAVIVPEIKNLETSPVKVKEVTQSFEGSVLSMKLGKDLRVKSLKISCPSEVSANCSVSTIDFNTVVGYTMTLSYNIKYPQTEM